MSRNWRSLARQRKVWREFYFDDGGDATLESIWQSYKNSPAYRGTRVILDMGGMLTTNVPLYLVKKLARIGGVVLPDCVTVTEDDPVIQEMLGYEVAE
jgi:hypothetical protein